MTDKEILNEVYARLNLKTDNGFEVHTFKSITGFIEREWQKQDDKGSPPPKWMKEDWRESYPPVDPCTSDIKEIERHRGLEIGPDGTVMEVK